MTAPAEHERVREEGLDSGAYLITCSCGKKYATEVWADEHAAVLAAHAQHVAAAETRPDETTDTDQAEEARNE